MTFDRVDNMMIWERVKETPKSETKEVKFGKRKFTAIDPTFQLEQATRLWGPYGLHWGLSNFEWKVIPAPVSEDPARQGNPIMMLSAVFRYPNPLGSEPREAIFPITVDMPLKENDDCTKKLITSARSKALSYLGFGADIFGGLYEDSQYVAEMEVKYEKQEQFRLTALSRIARCTAETELQGKLNHIRNLAVKKVITIPVALEIEQAIMEKADDLGFILDDEPAEETD